MNSEWTDLQLRASALASADAFSHGPPWELLEEMRESAPVLWTPTLGKVDGTEGFWSITRADDVASVSADWETFSLAADGPLINRDELGGISAIRQTLLGKDPGPHTLQRALVSSYFKPSSIRVWEPRIRAVAAERIEKLKNRESFELVSELALRVPIDVVSEILGIPVEDREQLFDWAQAVVAFEDPDVREEFGSAAEARTAAFAYSVKLLDERNRCPGDDIASAIATGTYGADPAPREDKAALFRQLIEAGADTTAATLVFALIAFTEHPDQWQLLRGNRELLRSAVEEVLRWASPVAYFRRTATRDATMRGELIRAGDPVVMWYVVANRDPEVFEDPYKFDITRPFRPNYTFGGGGPHICLGSNLARLELRILLDLLLDNLPHLRVTGPVTRIRGMAPMAFHQAVASCPVIGTQS